MKKTFTLFLVMVLNITALAQAPEKMSYQAIIRDADDNLVSNQTAGMRISILQGSAGGNPVYIETHAPVVNGNGLITIEIGNGTVSSGDFTAIDWKNGPYFLKTEVDPDGGSSYNVSGTSQLLSVPYAIYAGQAENAFSGDYQDLSHKPEIWDSTYSSIKNTPDLSLYATRDMGGEKITNLADPENGNDAANKEYVDAAAAAGWSLSGNAGTNPAGHFLGTTDKKPLVFKVNDSERMRLDTSGSLTFSSTGNSLFIGKGVGANDDLTDNYNVFVGDSAGHMNTTGEFNIAYGHGTLYSNTSGFDNTANGYQALYHNTAGSRNTAYGYQSLFNNTTGMFNTATGQKALYDNTSGRFNSATGYVALYKNTSGNANTANGYMALYSGTIGSYNTASGYQALNYNTTGSFNTADGYQALYKNNTGYSNVALGARALYENTTRSNLVAIGDSALFNNGKNASNASHSTENTAIGSKALYSNTTGYANIANGNQALYENTTGFNNTANGYRALYSNAAGHSNTANGYGALNSTTEGNYNTANGFLASNNNTTGAHNTSIGSFAGPYYSDLDNTGAFGYEAKTYSNNTIRIGNSSITQIGGYASWSNLSDGRFKNRVKPNVPGLDFIMKLQPVTFHWDLQALEVFRRREKGKAPPDDHQEKAGREKEKKVYTGFIAQEVEKAAADCGFDFSAIIRPTTPKSTYQLSYAEFVVPLVKAMQEQQKQIEEQHKLIEKLSREVERLKSLQ